MNKRLWHFILVWLFGLCYCFTAKAADTSWSTWLNEVKHEALAKGIRPELINELFHDMQPGQQQLKLSQTQPEKRLTFLQYRKSRIDTYRILVGRREYESNRTLLNDIGQRYGVDPTFVTAIWGIESSYGFYPGNFPVVKSLATLAYQSDRKDFFRNELFLALQILNDNQISVDKFKGEWAGASGQSQFLPSSWFKYAVDYDGDGRKNIWTSKADALASIANYLKMNGWETDQPWGMEVDVPNTISTNLIGLDIQKPMSFWITQGIKAASGDLPANDMMASLIEPEGGPNFLVFNNFRVLLTYNNSIYYAAAVSYLADKLGHRI